MARYGGTYTHLFTDEEFQRVTAKIKAREETIKKRLADAVNTTARRSVELAKEDYYATTTVRNKSYLDGKIVLARPATHSKPEATVWARSRATRADNFIYRVQPGRKGVFLNVAKGGGDVIRNAFVIPRAKSNGKPLILERLEKYKKGESRNFRSSGPRENRYGKLKNKRFKAVYTISPNQHFHDARIAVGGKAMSEAKQQFLRALNG